MTRTHIFELGQVLIVVTLITAACLSIYREPCCVPRDELLAWALEEKATLAQAEAWADGIWRVAELEANGLPIEKAERARIVLIDRLKAGAPAAELGARAAESLAPDGPWHRPR